MNQAQHLHLHGQKLNTLSALKEAFEGRTPLSSKWCLQDLLSKLHLSHLAQHRPRSAIKTQKVAKELDRLLERLRGRTNLSEAVTLDSFLKLSVEAQDILGSMLALEGAVRQTSPSISIHMTANSMRSQKSATR